MKRGILYQQITPMILCVALFTSMVSNMQGAIIDSRENLLSQLGTVAVTEDFESFVFPDNTAQRVGTTLDYSSGLGICEGVRFIQDNSNSNEGLQWDRQFQYGLTSAALVTDGKLIVDFLDPVSHVGLDIFWFDVYSYLAHPATIQVFGVDDVTLIYSFEIFEPFAPDFYFFGFSNPSGIGRVVLFRDESEGLGVSPIIDNLTFGTVPEPTTLILLGFGGLALRVRKNANTYYVVNDKSCS